MSFPVKAGEEAQAELKGLAEAELRELLGLIVKVKGDPTFGLPLEEHPEIGDLSDCRKLYFDGTRKRCIYKVHPDEANPTEIRLIAVGERADFRVYREAVERLGRTPGVDAPEN